MTDAKQLVTRYAELELQLKSIADEQKQIKTTLQEEMTTLGADQIKSEVGMFYFTTRRKWSYPESIAVLEEEVAETVKPLQEKIAVEQEKVSAAKKQAEESGEATAEESKSLAFKAEKLAIKLN